MALTIYNLYTLDVMMSFINMGTSNNSYKLLFKYIN
jgi:hypothetical protein